MDAGLKFSSKYESLVRQQLQKDSVDMEESLGMSHHSEWDKLPQGSGSKMEGAHYDPMSRNYAGDDLFTDTFPKSSENIPALKLGDLANRSLTDPQHTVGDVVSDDGRNQEAGARLSDSGLLQKDDENLEEEKLNRRAFGNEQTDKIESWLATSSQSVDRNSLENRNGYLSSTNEHVTANGVDSALLNGNKSDHHSTSSPLHYASAHSSTLQSSSHGSALHSSAILSQASGSALQHSSARNSAVDRSLTNGSALNSSANGSGLHHSSASGSGLHHNSASGSGLYHNLASGSGLHHHSASGPGLHHNSATSSAYNQSSSSSSVQRYTERQKDPLRLDTYHASERNRYGNTTTTSDFACSSHESVSLSSTSQSQRLDTGDDIRRSRTRSGESMENGRVTVANESEALEELWRQPKRNDREHDPETRDRNTDHYRLRDTVVEHNGYSSLPLEYSRREREYEPRRRHHHHSPDSYNSYPTAGKDYLPEEREDQMRQLEREKEILAAEVVKLRDRVEELGGEGAASSQITASLNTFDPNSQHTLQRKIQDLESQIQDLQEANESAVLNLTEAEKRIANLERQNRDLIAQTEIRTLKVNDKSLTRDRPREVSQRGHSNPREQSRYDYDRRDLSRYGYEREDPLRNETELIRHEFERRDTLRAESERLDPRSYQQLREDGQAQDFIYDREETRKQELALEEELAKDEVKLQRLREESLRLRHTHRTPQIQDVGRERDTGLEYTRPSHRLPHPPGEYNHGPHWKSERPRSEGPGLGGITHDRHGDYHNHEQHHRAQVPELRSRVKLSSRFDDHRHRLDMSHHSEPGSYDSRLKPDSHHTRRVEVSRAESGDIGFGRDLSPRSTSSERRHLPYLTPSRTGSRRVFGNVSEHNPGFINDGDDTVRSISALSDISDSTAALVFVPPPSHHKQSHSQHTAHISHTKDFTQQSQSYRKDRDEVSDTETEVLLSSLPPYSTSSHDRQPRSRNMASRELTTELDKSIFKRRSRSLDSRESRRQPVRSLTPNMMSSSGVHSEDTSHRLRSLDRSNQSSDHHMTSDLSSSAGFRTVSPPPISTQRNKPPQRSSNRPALLNTAAGLKPYAPRNPSDIQIDDVVKFSRQGGKISRGTVKYIGHLPGRGDVYLGVELERDEGKHDGVFEGVRYFQCKPNKAVFVAFNKVVMAWTDPRSQFHNSADQPLQQ